MHEIPHTRHRVTQIAACHKKTVYQTTKIDWQRQNTDKIIDGSTALER